MWVELAVSNVDGELAEAICEVLSAESESGVIVEETLLHPSLGEIERESTGRVGRSFSVRLVIEDPTGVPGRLSEALVRRIEKLKRNLWHLRAIRRFDDPQLREIDEVDWSEEWKSVHSRIKPAERIVVLPSWDRDPLKEGELDVRIDPGMAFGVGSHPSTQNCVALLEGWVEPGDRILDVGCGSGILSIAALRLGSVSAICCDIDGVCLESTKLNAKKNPGLEDRVALFHGSLDALRGEHDVIVINILAEVIVEMLPTARRLMAERGRMILGGILLEKEEGVLAGLERVGLEVAARRLTGDWVGLVVNRTCRS